LKTTTNRLDRTNHQQKTKLKLKSKKTIESWQSWVIEKTDTLLQAQMLI
jgi:hypothetical protein